MIDTVFNFLNVLFVYVMLFGFFSIAVFLFACYWIKRF